MQRVKLVVAAVMAVAALTAIASATASAALPEFLPASNTFTAKSGKGTLKAGAFSIICASDQVSPASNGLITGAKSVVTTVDFLSCEILGQAANTLGDKSGVILVELTGELCYINEKAKELGIYFTITPASGIHIEIPSLGQLNVTKGTVILKAEPVNKKSKTGTLKTKESEFKECGGKKAELLSALNEGTFEKGSETTTEEVTFTKEGELMG